MRQHSLSRGPIPNSSKQIVQNKNLGLKRSYHRSSTQKQLQIQIPMYLPQQIQKKALFLNKVPSINQQRPPLLSTLTHENKTTKHLIIKNVYNPNEQQVQMNILYEENQKLGYRINYLYDQNNFYRISINNINKLNNKITKDLDHNKHNKNASNQNNLQGQFNQKNKQNKFQQKGIACRLPLKRNFKYFTNHLNVDQNMNPKLNIQDNFIKGNEINSALATPNLAEPFSLISNKIHLKNLQMKVGSSIRKTQKLKKIYQGSISSLNKKAQLLQLQINKLSRQAEYYLIQEDLLKNIYKADYYINLNRQWNPNYTKKDINLPNLIHSNQNVDNNKNLDNNKADINTQHKDIDDFFEHYKQKQMPTKPIIKKKNLQLKRFQSPQTSDKLVVRFLSSECKINNLLNKNSRNSWDQVIHLMKHKEKFQHLRKQSTQSQQYKDRILIDYNDTSYNQQAKQNLYMNQKQLFELSPDIIKLVLSSLQKEEIQQINRLESLKKQQKDLRKNKTLLMQTVQKLSQQKKKLKHEIDLQLRKSCSFGFSPSLSGPNPSSFGLNASPNLLTSSIQNPSTFIPTQIYLHKVQADKLLSYNKYQKQLLASIQKQDKLLQEQYKINQQFKQKIIDRNQQENKEIKVLDQQVNKCIQQVKDIKLKYKALCLAKGRNFVGLLLKVNDSTTQL